MTIQSLKPIEYGIVATQRSQGRRSDGITGSSLERAPVDQIGTCRGADDLCGTIDAAISLKRLKRVCSGDSQSIAGTGKFDDCCILCGADHCAIRGAQLIDALNPVAEGMESIRIGR